MSNKEAEKEKGRQRTKDNNINIFYKLITEET